MDILVMGSLNMDLVARVPRLPGPGETLHGTSFVTTAGGKGANQAAAVARLGGRVGMFGRVGEDAFGQELIEGLAAFGVDLQGVVRTPGPSGVALIAVDERAENSIIVVPGANGQVGKEDLGRLRTALVGARVLLLQLEIPLETVAAAAALARAGGVHVILDPAPAAELPPELYRQVDTLTPNEGECAALVGFPLRDMAQVRKAADELERRGVRQVVIKLGEKGAYLQTAGEGVLVPPFRVEAVDTTAAGDAFNGALAVALGKGASLQEAVRFANAAGALATTRRGAQASLPTAPEVDRLLEA